MSSLKRTQIVIGTVLLATLYSGSQTTLAQVAPGGRVNQIEAAPLIPPQKPNTISAGFYHSCGIQLNVARCWGDNRDGQIGDGTNAQRLVPTDTIGLNGIATAITTGAYHSCALVSTGVKCWGHNTYGQVGDGTTSHRYSSVSVVGLGSGVQTVSAGGFHTCATTDSGGVKCWGANYAGQLGNGTTIDQHTPIDVSNLRFIVAISAGYAHTCALNKWGRVRCWGDNSYGQLGAGTSGNYQTQPIVVPGIDHNVIAIAAGGAFTCATIRDGSVQCWGDNSFGELGDGTSTSHLSPALVIGLNGSVSSIATGTTSACAIVGAAVHCWGDNSSGQLGDGTTANRYQPHMVVNLNSAVSVAVGDQHACAQTPSAIKCWGREYFGELGDNSFIFRTTPVDVLGLSNANALGAGGHHACAIAGGGVKCWGWNLDGQVGDGTAFDRLTPTGVIGLDSTVTMIAVGYAHNCAATIIDTVQCWGQNASGQIGDGTFSDKSRAVEVIGLNSSVSSIATGYSHSCTSATNGGVKCWGDNAYGELGNGASGNAISSPIPVDVIGLSNVIQVAAGYLFTCALTSNGGVKCWGWNLYGQLGDGTNTNHMVPTDVSGLSSGAIAISAGWYHACALLNNGSLKCWGSNGSGQIGDGTTTDRSAPVDVVGLMGNVSQVSAGWQHTCVRTIIGAAKCWGLNFNGAVGDGTTTSRSTPINVTGLNSGVTLISGGQNYTCALLANGSSKCWGFNYYGQLGNNQAGHRTTPVSALWNSIYYFPLVAK